MFGPVEAGFPKPDEKLRDQYNSLSPRASGATAAAIMAHTAASGFTTNCRDVPKMAYATSGSMLE